MTESEASMAEIFNLDTVDEVLLPGGTRKRRLIDESRVERTRCRFDQLTMDAGTSLQLETPEANIVWGQILEGAAILHSADGEKALAESSVFLLPPRYQGALSSSEGAKLLRLEIANAIDLDPTLSSLDPVAQFFDLGAEPVLQSEHDERTRIYVASSKLFGTTALAGELVIFPAGTSSANHHHVGAEHFQLILRGSGTVYIDETPHRIRPGDLVYKYDRERHYCQNDDDGELAFLEFFAPGEWETVWADADRSCTWSPTGENLRGGKASREIASHTSDGTVYEDV